MMLQAAEPQGNGPFHSHLKSIRVSHCLVMFETPSVKDEVSVFPFPPGD